MMDTLKEMVDKQKKDLDRGKREIMEKEGLCSTLKVCRWGLLAAEQKPVVFYNLSVILNYFVTFTMSNRSRWCIWRHNRRMPSLPERRPRDSEPK